MDYLALLEGKGRGAGIVDVVSRCATIVRGIERGAWPSPVWLVKAGVSRDVGRFLARINEVLVFPAFERAVRDAPYGNDLVFRVTDESVKNLLIGCRRVGGTGRQQQG